MSDKLSVDFSVSKLAPLGIKLTFTAYLKWLARCIARDSFSHACIFSPQAKERPRVRRVGRYASRHLVRSHGKEALSPVEHLSPKGSATNTTRTGDLPSPAEDLVPVGFGLKTRSRVYAPHGPYLDTVVPRHDGSMH